MALRPLKKKLKEQEELKQVKQAVAREDEPKEQEINSDTDVKDLIMLHLELSNQHQEIAYKLIGSYY